LPNYAFDARRRAAAGFEDCSRPDQYRRRPARSLQRRWREHAQTVGGSPARRIAGARSSYLYVCIDDPAYAKGPQDVYVVVEAFDDTVALLTLQYDKDNPAPNIATRYTSAEQTAS